MQLLKRETHVFKIQLVKPPVVGKIRMPQEEVSHLRD